MSLREEMRYRVLREAAGAELVPLATTARLLGYEKQTMYNQLHEGRCLLEPVRVGRNVRFRAEEIVDVICSGVTPFAKRGGE